MRGLRRELSGLGVAEAKGQLRLTRGTDERSIARVLNDLTAYFLVGVLRGICSLADLIPTPQRAKSEDIVQPGMHVHTDTLQAHTILIHMYMYTHTCMHTDMHTHVYYWLACKLLEFRGLLKEVAAMSEGL